MCKVVVHSTERYTHHTMISVWQIPINYMYTMLWLIGHRSLVERRSWAADFAHPKIWRCTPMVRPSALFHVYMSEWMDIFQWNWPSQLITTGYRWNWRRCDWEVHWFKAQRQHAVVTERNSVNAVAANTKPIKRFQPNLKNIQIIYSL